MDVSEAVKDFGGEIILGAAWLIKELIKKRNEKEKKKHGIENYNNLERLVIHIETHLYKNYDPMRVFVIHFSNGTRTEANVSLQKITILHEIKDRNIDSLAPTHSQLPIPGFMYYMIKRTREKGDHYIEDIEYVRSPNEDYYLWMKNYGVSSQYTVEIKSKKSGLMTAVLVLQFDRIKPLTKEQRTFIKEQTKRIEAHYDNL